MAEIKTAEFKLDAEKFFKELEEFKVKLVELKKVFDSFNELNKFIEVNFKPKEK